MTPEEQDIMDRSRRVVGLHREGRDQEAMHLASETVEVARGTVGDRHPAFAAALGNVAFLHRASGDPRLAIPLVQQALEIFRGSLGPRHPKVAEMLGNLASLHRETRDLAAALPLLEESLEVFREAYGPRHPAVADVLRELADLRRDMGEPSEAERLSGDAQEMYRDAFAALGGPEAEEGSPTDRIPSLRMQIRELDLQGRYSEAIGLAEEIVRLVSEALGDRHADVARALRDVALLHVGTGDDAAAIPSLERAVEIFQGSLGPGHQETVEALRDLASLRQKTGDLASAERSLREAVESLREAPGPEGRELAEAMEALAAALQDLGNHGAAEPLYREVVEIRRGVLGPRHPDVARSLNNLAVLHSETGNYASADPLYREALAIRRETFGPRHPDVASSLTSLAELARQMGDYAAAETSAREALEIRREAFSARSPDVATALNILASVHYSAGKLALAEPLFREALEIRREALGVGDPRVATIQANLSLLYVSMGNLEAAEPLAREALEIRREALGPRHPEVAKSLNNVAFLHLATGDHATAVRLFMEALDIFRETLGGRHPDVATALDNVATQLAAMGRDREALASMAEAADIHDRIVGDVFEVGSERQRLALLMMLHDHMDGYLSLVLRRFPDDSQVVGSALDFVLRRKGIAAEALAAQRNAVLGGRYPDLAQTLDELARLRMQIAQKTLAGPGPEGVQEHERLLAELSSTKESLERELARGIPESRLAERLRESDRAAVAQALPGGSVLVEYVRITEFDFTAVRAEESQWKAPRYLAFVLGAREPHELRMVDLGEAGPIDECIAVFRDAIAGQGRDRAARGKETDPVAARTAERTAGAELREIVFDPLMPHIGDRTRVFLAPDGDLTRLPFEVLPTRDRGRLIEAYAFSYLSSGRDVLRFEAPAIANAAPPLVAAAPDFDLTGTSFDDVPLGRRSRALDPNVIHFDPLEGTEEEGRGIGKVVGASPWLGGAVLEAPLKASRSPRILHLATHGFFLPDQRNVDLETLGLALGANISPLRRGSLENPLLRSGLALAGANTFLHERPLPEDAEDGILTAEDVSGLDLLGTELVVLSACETGLGEVRVGEGVFGLRRAFVLAGARTLVMSLWKVPDQPSADLMQAFYGNLDKGMGRAEALREAQLDLARIYPPPWFWGAFICQGDPGPLELNITAARRPAKESRARKEAPGAPTAKEPTLSAENEPIETSPPPVVEPEPTPAPEPRRSLAELVSEAGLLFLEGGGNLAIPFEGPRAGQGIVQAREFGEGMALFSVQLPALPGRLGRKKALRNLLRVSHSANYTKAVLFDSGEAVLSAETPMAVLTPAVASGLIRGLAALGDLNASDLGDARRWSERISACLRDQATSLRVDVADAAATIPGILAEAGDATMTLPDGSILAALDLSAPVPEVLVQWNEGVVLLIAHLKVAPHGDEKRYLSRLLGLNGMADVAKVGLDTDGRVALLYEVPRLTPELMPEIKAQLAMLAMGVAGIDSES